MHFSRIKVSDLLLVNAEGQTVLGDRPLNKAAFAIHAAIYEHNQKIIAAAAHTQSTYGKAGSTLGRKLDTLTQDTCVFHDDVALFGDFTGMVVDESEGLRIAKALGDRKGAILKNHGILTAGPTVEAAAWWYVALDNACHTQLLAEAAGTPQPIDDAVARHTHGQIGGSEGALHSFESLFESRTRVAGLKADMSRYSTVTRTTINRRLALQGVAGAIAMPAFSLRAQTRSLLKVRDLANAVLAAW